MPASVRVPRWRGVAAVTLTSGSSSHRDEPAGRVPAPRRRVPGPARRRRGLPAGPHHGPAAARPVGQPAGRTGLPRRPRPRRPGRARPATDPNGLPIHGTMSAREPWDVGRRGDRRPGRAAPGRVRVRGRGPAGRPPSHRLETAIGSMADHSSVATTIRPSGGRSVPVSFGYHPYFAFPEAAAPAWRLLLPRRRHVELDERGIPTRPEHRGAGPGRADRRPNLRRPVRADRRPAPRHPARNPAPDRPLRRRLPVRAGVRPPGAGLPAWSR